MMFKQGAFAIDPNATPEQIAKKRAMIAAMMPKFGSAKYVGEGLGQLVTGVVAGRQNRKLNDAETAGNAEAKAFRDRILSGVSGGASGGYSGGGGYAPSGTPWTPTEKVPLPPADPGMIGATGGFGFAGAAPADPGMIGAAGGLTLPPQGGGTAEEIFQAELMAGGLPEHVVHGIMMNGKDESNFDPNAVGDGGAALGILQWNGPRKRALEEFAALVGGNPTDPRIQAQFTLHELQGTESAAFDAVMSTKSAGEAGAAFVNTFERPAEVHRARREAAYLGGAAPSGGSAPASGAAPSYGGAPPQIPMNDLYAILSDPWQPPEVKAMVQTMIAEQQQASDPMYQMEMEKAQLELDALRNPGAEPVDYNTFNGPDGTVYRFNPATGIAEPITGGEAPKPGYRPMTPEEGAARNVNPAEYQVSPEGKIEKIGGGGVSVTVDNGTGEVGTIPQGFELFTDPVTGARSMRPIPGGPEDKTVSADLRKQMSVAATETATTAAQRAFEAAMTRTVDGVVGAIASYNPESLNAEVYRQTDALKAMASLESLTAMRNASPTGAGMGNPTDRDAVLLEQKHGALDPKSPNYPRDLLDYTRALFRTIHGPEAGDALFDDQFSDQIASVAGAATPPPAADADGWKTINGVKIRVKQ